MEYRTTALERLQSDLEELIKTITKFSTIVQSHLNDFIISEVWSNTRNTREELSKQLEKGKLDNTMPCCYYYEPVNTSETNMDFHGSDSPNLNCGTQRKCHRYCKKRYVDTQTNDNEKNLNTFLTVKKEHEVVCLSSLLNDVADESSCRKVCCLLYLAALMFCIDMLAFSFGRGLLFLSE